MFQLMAEAFCHFIFSVNYNFLSIFIECLNRDLLRTGGTRYTPGNSRQTKQRFSIISLLCLPFCQIFLQA